MRKLTEIIIHTSATRKSWMQRASSTAKVNEIRRWHVEDNGWSDIGYHYIIDRNGVVIEGRPLERTGAHTKGHNTGTVGICLIGGHGGSEADNFSDHYTHSQESSLRDLIRRLKTSYPTIREVSGHNEYAAKACPCFNVKKWY